MAEVCTKSAVPPGFDPEHYRWWDRWQCAAGYCARGFDFHAAGSTPHGRHAIGKQTARRVAEPEPPTLDGMA